MWGDDVLDPMGVAYGGSAPMVAVGVVDADEIL